MSWSLLALRTQTRMYLDEVSPTEWTDIMINTELNNGYMGMVTAVMNVFEDYYITKAYWDTIANQQEYTVANGVPADIYKTRRIEVNYNPDIANNYPVRALPVNIEAIKMSLSNANSINAVRATTNYYERGFESSKVYGFLPIPSKNGTDAVMIMYIPTISKLSSDIDLINVPYADRYGYLICKFAAAHCLRKGQMEETVARQYLAEYGGGIALMQEELTPKIAEESKQIIDSVGENIDFSLP